jgi:hypothetical protein
MKIGYWILLIALATCGASSLQGANRTWIGGTSDWANTANWSGGAVPGSGDLAIFDGTGTTTTVTNVSGTVQGIHVTSSTPVSLSMTLSGPLTLAGGSGIGLLLRGGNALAITNSAANDLIILADIEIGDGVFTVSSDVQFGTASSSGRIGYVQRNGNVSFGNVTVAEVTSGSNSNEVEMRRRAAGSGTLTMASLTVGGDRTDSTAGPENNSARLRFENLALTVTGNLVIQDGSGGAGNEGSGAQLEVDDCTITIGGNLDVGTGTSTNSDSAANLEVEDSTVTFATASQLRVRANCQFQIFRTTLTSTGAWSLDVALAADVCLVLDCTVTANAAGNLTISLGCTAQSFAGILITNTDFSNYTSAGVQFKAGSELATLNECTFTNGQSGGSHITFNGLAVASTLVADLNLFDTTTGTGATALVNVASATSLGFRTFTGGDFGVGATVISATDAENRDNDGSIPGTNVVWAATFNLVTVSNTGQARGLRSDTTANQFVQSFQVTSNVGNNTITALSFMLDVYSFSGGSLSTADIASMVLFHDINADGVVDAGETLATDTTLTDDSADFTGFSRTINAVNVEDWALALTFASSVSGESGGLSTVVLPTVGISAGLTTLTMGLPLATWQEIRIAGPAAALEIREQPGTAAAGAAFGDQPKIVVVDANGQVVGWDNNTYITPSILTDPVGGSSLIGSDATGANVLWGELQFTSLGINQAGNGFVLRFTASPALTASSTVDSQTFNVSSQPSEINIQRSSTNIADGGSDAVGSRSTLSAFTLTYTIQNTGAGQLTLGAISFPATSNCTPSVTTPPTSPVAPTTGTTTMVVSVTLASGSGSFSFDISIVNNDSNESPYNFTISGTRIEPDVEIRFNSVAVADGASHAVTGGVASVALNVQYTIVNTGTENLTLTGGTPVTVTMGTTPGNCSIGAITQPGLSVIPAGGGSTTFSVLVTPSAAGAFDFDVDLASNDPNENPYDVRGQGTATAAPEPEINILRNSTSIASGGPDALGSVLIGALTNFTYTIDNSAGSAALVLSGSVTATVQTGCTAAVTQPSPTTIPAGSSSTFVVGVTPALASFSFTLTITSNDTNEATYTVLVSGTGSATAPEIDVQRPAPTSIADGGTDNLGNQASGTPVVYTYTIANTGNSTLTLGATAVSVSNNIGCVVSVTTQPATSVTAAGLTTFQITVTASSATFSFDVAINNDDANESPYNFAVAGTTGSGGGGGGGDNGGDGGCTTSPATGWLFWAILGFSAVALARRRRITA